VAAIKPGYRPQSAQELFAAGRFFFELASTEIALAALDAQAPADG
jgi:hypothetical protein